MTRKLSLKLQNREGGVNAYLLDTLSLQNANSIEATVYSKHVKKTSPVRDKACVSFRPVGWGGHWGHALPPAEKSLHFDH